ncbi:hypothetical protein [Archangium minus]|uniref:hypothetical protein n=1 Tax=Archangium minus TaxID=83450 RepID=UPI0037BE6C68
MRAWVQSGHLPCLRTGRLWSIRKDQLLSCLERGPSPADTALPLEEGATRRLARRASDASTQTPPVRKERP